MIVTVTMDTTPKQVFTVPVVKIGKIKSIEILNGSSSDVVITIQDVYTPSPTDENPSPTEKIIERKVIKVLAGDDISLDNQNIEVLGTCQIVSSVTDPNIKVTLTFDYVL